MSRIDQVLKWIWLGIGVAMLALLAFVGVLFVRDLVRGGGGGGDAVPAKPAATQGPERPRVVRYGTPAEIRGSATRIVLVRHGQGYGASLDGGYASGSGSDRPSEGPVVNVAFLDTAGGQLLLDRPAYIRGVTWPGGTAESVPMNLTDSLPPLPWIVYEMALDDSNSDGRLDHRDGSALYVTDLDGRGLRRVLPAGFELRHWERQRDGSLVITALPLPPAGKKVDRDELPQRAFVMATNGQVRPYAALDSLAEAAGRILRK